MLQLAIIDSQECLRGLRHADHEEHTCVRIQKADGDHNRNTQFWGEQKELRETPPMEHFVTQKGAFVRNGHLRTMKFSYCCYLSPQKACCKN